MGSRNEAVTTLLRVLCGKRALAARNMKEERMGGCLPNPPKEQLMPNQPTPETADGSAHVPEAVLANDDRIPIDWRHGPVVRQRKIVDRIFKARPWTGLRGLRGRRHQRLANKVFTVLEELRPYESEHGVHPDGARSTAPWRATATITSWRRPRPASWRCSPSSRPPPSR